MGKYLKMFTTHEEYEEFKASSGMAHPNVSICESSDEIHYEKSTSKTGLQAKYLFYTRWNYPLELSNEYFIYDGEIVIDGNQYYKWKKYAEDQSEAEWVEDTNPYILTETRNFKDISLYNRFSGVVGSIRYDSFEEGYDISKGNICCATTRIPDTFIMDLEHHDTQNLNANGYEYVDLGLPSGTLWAKYNVDSYDYDDVGYDYYHSKSFGAGLGGNWRVPSYKNYHELLLYTTTEETLNGNVCIRCYTSKINGNKLYVPRRRNTYRLFWLFETNEDIDTGDYYDGGVCYASSSGIHMTDPDDGLPYRLILY